MKICPTEQSIPKGSFQTERNTQNCFCGSVSVKKSKLNEGLQHQNEFEAFFQMDFHGVIIKKFFGPSSENIHVCVKGVDFFIKTSKLPWLIS